MTSSEVAAGDPVEHALLAGLANGPDPDARSVIDRRVELEIDRSVARRTERAGTQGRQARRLRPMSRMARLVLAAAALLVLAGTAVAGGPAFLTGPQVKAEAQTEAEHLSWPPGMAVPSFADPVVITDPRWWGSGEPPMASGSLTFVFGPGFGKNEAGFAWICAWSKEWLTTRSVDRARAQEALRQLDTIKSIGLWANLEGGSLNELLDAISAAKRGDAGPLLVQRQAIGCQS